MMMMTMMITMVTYSLFSRGSGGQDADVRLIDLGNDTEGRKA